MDGLIDAVMEVAEKRAAILRNMKEAVQKDNSSAVMQYARDLFGLTLTGDRRHRK
jgi:hypothetical protein